MNRKVPTKSAGGIRPRPPMFRALGKEEPPDEITIEGQRYQRKTVFKHDSWAATALYQSLQRTIVCKFNRRQGISFLPMTWLGRLLAGREKRILNLLAGAPCVPGVLGGVVAGGR